MLRSSYVCTTIVNEYVKVGKIVRRTNGWIKTTNQGQEFRLDRLV
jgi:hypothetical protein